MSVRCLMQNLLSTAQQMSNSIQSVIIYIIQDFGTLSGTYAAMDSQSFTALCFRVSQPALLLGETDTYHRWERGFAPHLGYSFAKLNILKRPWDHSLFCCPNVQLPLLLLPWPLPRIFGRWQSTLVTFGSSFVRFLARRTMDDDGRHGNMPPDSYIFDFERKMNDGAAA